MMDVKHRVDALMGRQYRCPTGLLGHAVGELMVRQHGPETRWTLSLLGVSATDRVLEIECGAGRAIALAAALAPEGHVTGLDLSRAMVRVASRRNARAIKEGRVSVRQGDVAHLPCHLARFLALFLGRYFAPSATARVRAALPFVK